MKLKKINNLGLDFWVKVSVILQAVTAIGIVCFTYLQFNLNRDMEKQYILDESFSVKNSLADLMFQDDKTKKEAKMRNILERLEENLKKRNKFF